MALVFPQQLYCWLSQKVLVHVAQEVKHKPWHCPLQIHWHLVSKPQKHVLIGNQLLPLTLHCRLRPLDKELKLKLSMAVHVVVVED